MIGGEGTVTLSKLELERLIRCARLCRDQVQEQKLLLQEKELVHGNGHVREAVLTCENDIYVLTSAVAKLWQMLHAHPPPGGAHAKLR